MAEYDRDFYAWTLAQAEALQAKDWQALDLQHLADEIEAAATEETGLPLATFPEQCPWTIGQLQDDDFLPA